MTKGGVSTEAIVGTYTNNMVILGMNQRKGREMRYGQINWEGHGMTGYKHTGKRIEGTPWGSNKVFLKCIGVCGVEWCPTGFMVRG